MRLLTSSPTNEFKNEEIYAFAGELEKLHPDNRHIHAKSASSFKSCVTVDLFDKLVVF